MANPPRLEPTHSNKDIETGSRLWTLWIYLSNHQGDISRHSLVLQINHPHLPTDIAAKTIDDWHKENASFRNLLHLVNPSP